MPAVIVGVFGSLIGSFLNVVIFRVPTGRSIVSPPSACTRCGSRIRGYDNIPVLSWLILRGRCRDCRAPISARYPTVELATGLFFAAVTIWALYGQRMIAGSTLGVIAGLAQLLAFLYLAAISVALAMIDLDTHTLPNRIVLPGYAVGVVLLGASGTLSGDGGALLRAGVGMAAMWLLYLTMALAYPGGMGFGDVKLAGVLGLFLGFLGWQQLIVGAFAAFIFGGIFSLGLLALRKANRRSGIPFGPWMLGGAWIGVFFGAPIVTGYLALFGLA